MEQLARIAFHPWDVHGAAHAGLHTGWVNRKGATYTSFLHAADVTASDLPGVAEQLAQA